jgi:hypothetical protein
LTGVFALDAFAWPIAFVLVALVFMGMFKSPISALLNRTKKVGKSGLETHDHAQLLAPAEDRSALADYMGQWDNPLLKEQEAEILKDLEDRGLGDPEAARTVLVRTLAGTQLRLLFENIQTSIFASQIALLIHLNGLPEGLEISGARVFFEGAASDFPTLYEGRTFEDWAGFLGSFNLVTTEHQRVGISRVGREFLKWRLEDGRLGPTYG